MFVTETLAGRMGAQQDVAAANRMYQAGVDQETIYDETGWFVGPDGIMRSRISDESFELTGDLQNGGDSTLGDAISHDNLFEIAPELEDIPIIADPDAPDRGAYYDGPGWGAIVVQDADDETAISHEVQHGLHDLLNLPPGSNGSSPEIAGGHDEYMNDNGEIEAWQTMNEIGLSEEQVDTPDLLIKAEEEGIEPVSNHRPSIGL